MISDEEKACQLQSIRRRRIFLTSTVNVMKNKILYFIYYFFAEEIPPWRKHEKVIRSNEFKTAFKNKKTTFTFEGKDYTMKRMEGYGPEVF